MSGTQIGAAKAAATNKAKYGKDFYVRIGQLGGLKSRGGGFTNNPELARRAGKIGGTRSRGSKEVFVLDDSEFGEGFNSPTWKDKVLRRIK